MGIFGTDQPKIITSGGTTILLDAVVVLKDEPVFDRVRHQSVLSGDREYVCRGYHWIYQIKKHLYKHETVQDHFIALHGALYDEVTLYRHRDHDPIQDSSGTVVPFKFLELKPFYLETVNYHDAAILTFESTKFIDITKSMQGLLVDDLGRKITDDLGRKIGII